MSWLGDFARFRWEGVGDESPYRRRDFKETISSFNAVITLSCYAAFFLNLHIITKSCTNTSAIVIFRFPTVSC